MNMRLCDRGKAEFLEFLAFHHRLLGGLTGRALRIRPAGMTR